MTEDSILEEVLAENAELRKLVGTNEYVPSTIESLSSFSYEELKDKLKISGVLIAEGVWNGVKYTAEQIKKMYNKWRDKLSNLPIKVEHERTKEFKNEQVGKHTGVEFNETLKAILYKGEITDPDAIKEVKEGKFRATSLKSEMRKVSLDGEEIGEDINPIDNSLTEYPACDKSQVFTIQALSDKTDDIEYFGVFNGKEDLNTESDIKGVEEEIMEDIIELKEGEVLVLPKEIEELEDVFEEYDLEVLPEEEAIKNGRRVVYRYKPKYKKYPKRVKRKKGYYYYPYGDYPVPYYYWSYNMSEIDMKEEELSIEELFEMLGLPKNPEKGQMVKQKVRNRWVVFKATGKKGFGAWKILKSFEKEGEADEFMKSKKTTEEEDSAWTECIATERKGGKSFKEAVDACKKKLGKKGKEEEAEEFKCDACGKVFKTQDELDEHKKECKGEGEEKEYPEKKEGKEEKMSKEELAEKEIKCPACGKTFGKLKEFKEHWVEKEEPKYGEYKKAKKLTKKLLEDKEFRKAMKVHCLSEEKEEEVKTEDTKVETEKTEEKTEEKKKEVKTEEEEEDKKEKPKEDKKEVKEEEKKEEKKTLDYPTVIDTISKDVGLAAEVLIAREKKED